MSSPSRKRTAGVLGLAGTLVAGALGGAMYVALTFSGSAAPAHPQQVTIHQAAATATPTTAPKAKAAVKHKAKKKTSTVSRNLVSAQDVPTDPQPEATQVPPPPIPGNYPDGPIDASHQSNPPPPAN